MSKSSSQDDDSTGMDLMALKARELVQQLEAGHPGEAIALLHELNMYRDQTLYAEVGKLTRSLHDAIVNFHLDTKLSTDDKSELNRMRDASERLNYVIEMTEKAANKTMDMVETAMPRMEERGKEARELRGAWQKVLKKQISPDEFRQICGRLDDFLRDTANETDRLRDDFNTVLLAQDYQDLTGQVIKRVIKLVQEVEDSLVRLVKMASQVDAITGTKHQIEVQVVDAAMPEGPIINPEKREDAVANQDDVDDLLSSLGF